MGGEPRPVAGLPVRGVRRLRLLIAFEGWSASGMKRLLTPRKGNDRLRLVPETRLLNLVVRNRSFITTGKGQSYGSDSANMATFNQPENGRSVDSGAGSTVGDEPCVLLMRGNRNRRKLR